ncbi:hypothetical protein NQ314_015552 [Rhamnusium bicolor]|uniref:DUF243 domain-containing protein n=1 Tax=Rhamnusium bicolor TaxID=1586634 RepID=A0AAV8WZ42_9CUCU|nr:hypothetical protein NQ314_015552 [Rhamnusium bicolor]
MVKDYLIIGSLVVLVYGRPEPPSGYQYPSPSQLSQHSQASSYSAPLASVGALSGSRFGSISGSRFTSQGSFSSASSSFSGSAGGRSRYSSRGNGRQYSGNGHSLSDNILVHKHIYVHVPPPEHDEEHHHRKQVHIPAPQKHYKIIFIKAPSAASSVAPVISPLPQNEEKNHCLRVGQ